MRPSPGSANTDTMARCPHCAAELETPLGCPACGKLFYLATEPTPFDIFDLRPSFAVDAGELRRKLLKLGRLTHPDFFATQSTEMKARAEHASALLNSAHETLVDDVARADWLVRHLGGPDENEVRDMPKPFLMEVLEWNERLEEVRHSKRPSASDLAALESGLRERRASITDTIRGALTPLPARGSAALREARRELNAIRYVDRAIEEIESLRLSQAAKR